MGKIVTAICLICLLIFIGGCEGTGKTVNVPQQEQEGKLITVKEQSVEIHKPTSPPTTVPSGQDGNESGNLSNKELIDQLSKEKGINTSDSSQAGGETETVTILNFKGIPSELEITAGTTVTWLNKDVYVHKIGIFHVEEGPRLAKGETWSYTFTEPGTYLWMSMSRPKTNGAIIVT
jgi:plastocyanin